MLSRPGTTSSGSLGRGSAAGRFTKGAGAIVESSAVADVPAGALGAVAPRSGAIDELCGNEAGMPGAMPPPTPSRLLVAGTVGAAGVVAIVATGSSAPVVVVVPTCSMFVAPGVALASSRRQPTMQVAARAAARNEMRFMGGAVQAPCRRVGRACAHTDGLASRSSPTRVTVPGPACGRLAGPQVLPVHARA